jgi:5-histidylcysteine sulfoxide synthase
MMLSPQAARMGTVFTTLRSIGKRGMARTKNRAWIGSYASNNMTFGTTTRHNNTLAYYDDDTNYSAVKPPAWMMNVGRECDKWLHGARSDDWFTGVHPTKCPGVDRKGILRSCALPNLSAVTRKAAKDYFDNSWTLYETLFAGLKGDDPFYRPPVHGLRHPQIFYYGHTACLYVNKLRLSGVLDKPVNAHFESIFEVGVDEMLWDDMNKNDMIWPTVKEVHDYRKQVYKVVTDAILHHPSFNDDTTTLVNQQHPMWALFLGFEHERIHLETSSVLFREMPLELVQRPRNWPPLHPSAYHHDGNNKNNNMQHHRQHFPPITTKNPVPGVHYPVNPMIAVDDTQSVDLGKPADFPSFGWDNEYGERNVNVPPFQASAYMVTNGEFYQFVQMGGYRTREYWCEDGWAWRVHRNMKGPFFWQLAGPAGTHEYKLRTIFEVISMPWNCKCSTETFYEIDDRMQGYTYRLNTPCCSFNCRAGRCKLL